MNHRLVLTFAIIACLVAGCRGQFRKGEKYMANNHADSLLYLMLDQGKGYKVARKAAGLKYGHESKGNSCQVIYASDSASLSGERVYLLSHIALPDMAEDLLTGGFIGTFTSRQDVIYVIVPAAELNQYFHSVEKK